jgi:lysine-specific demethylase/histidyl-hydroxylase NO66
LKSSKESQNVSNGLFFPGLAPPKKEVITSKPEAVAKLSKSAEKRKRKRMSDISNRDENGKSPKVAKMSNEVSASPKLTQKRKEVNGTPENSKKAKTEKSPKAKVIPAAKPSPKESKKSKKSSKKESAAPISNGSVENDVEEQVESMATKPREVEDELVPVEAEKKKGKKNKKSKDKNGEKEEKIPTLVKIPKTSAPQHFEKDGSLVDGKACFEWMIHPIKSDLFFGDSFEKRPIHIKRGQPDYYKHLLSTKVFDNMLRDQNVVFGKNLDVTSYSDGKRETHNPEGRAYGPGNPSVPCRNPKIDGHQCTNINQYSRISLN